MNSAYITRYRIKKEQENKPPKKISPKYPPVDTEKIGGLGGNWTPDLLVANQAFYH